MHRQHHRCVGDQADRLEIPGQGDRHLAGELFKSTAHLQMQHVPCKGSAAALTDVIAGNLAFLIDVVSTTQPQIRAGKAVGDSGAKPE